MLARERPVLNPPGILAIRDLVIPTNEKISIQARWRIHATRPRGAGESMQVEHESERQGTSAYLEGRDALRAKIFGRCDLMTGIGPFEGLVTHVMGRESYRSARCVFCIMDDDSSHRGAECVERFGRRWPTLASVHTRIHARWLNYAEGYSSVVLQGDHVG
ncbi:MAG: hypothetical protein AUI63_04785 [Gemmatimonadetes bacterium 13_1_40CM_2_60_3]|nr:MAG: hypothetical protein AUI63_04785 [Gemmatimonadetes bacterium 13_1_40CM_2_60_3]